MSDTLRYATGQITGLTGLSMQQIQRYVRNYPMGFTQDARKPKKGRRFTGSDIKSLLLIRHLLQTRQRKMIPQALTGEWVPPDFMVFEIYDMMSMYQALQKLHQDTNILLQKVTAQKNSLDLHASYLITNLRGLRERESERIRAVKQLEDRVNYLFKRLPKSNNASNPQEPLKEKGFLDRWVDSHMNE